MDGAEQYIQTNDHVSELASNGFFGSHHIVNVNNAINLGFAHRSMKCLSQESQGLSKMTAHIDTSHFLGIKHLMKISNESRLHLALQRHPNIIPQHSHAYHAVLTTTPLLRRQTFPIEIERTIPSRLSISREVFLERQRLLNGLFNMRYSPVLSNEQQLDRENNNPQDDMLPGFFPVKLHRLLLDLDQGREGVHIAHFVPNGKAFCHS